MIFTKIVITNCHERYLLNAQKQAIFEILMLHYLKFQIPTAYGLTKLILLNAFIFDHIIELQ